MEIREEEVIRYLGYRQKEPDDMTRRKIRQVSEQLTESLRPATVCRRFPVLHPEEDRVQIGDMDVRSRGLSRNLRDCAEAWLIAATLGTEADRLVRRAMLRDTAEAAVLQAAEAAMIESVCDDLQEELRKRAAGEGLALRPRFSPGYGDFSLEHQRDFSRLLNMGGKIGVTLTGSLLMVPTKSVTAVIGLVRGTETPETVSCSDCEARDCEFRRKESG